jgi:MFS family permease
MLPATLAILSGTFRGRERASAFAAWGATAGVAAAAGPVVGGFLTTNYSWRWSFRINVIIAPIAIIGALLFMRRGERSHKRVSIDIPGACLVAVGMFLLVFALSEGGSYGWIRPVKDFTLGGHLLWPAWRTISIIPLVIATSVLILGAFYVLERWKERRHADPLFEFAHLRHLTYRYGLLTGLVLGMGQLGLSFVLPVFLQGARHLTAWQNGLWQLPTGLFVIVGAQVGGRLIHKLGTTIVVRIGLVMYASGVAYIAQVVSVHLTALGLLPGLALYGVGIGFAGAQLTNVVLSEIPKSASGVASGANTTVRQVGAALGVAIIGTLLTAQTLSHTTANLARAPISTAVKVSTIAGIHQYGASYKPPATIGPAAHASVQHAIESGLVSGTRIALLFAMTVVAIGAIVSFRIPRVPAYTEEHPEFERAERLEPLEPIDVDPSLVLDETG